MINFTAYIRIKQDAEYSAQFLNPQLGANPIVDEQAFIDIHEMHTLCLFLILSNIFKRDGEPLKHLDLCAAPGGKTTLLNSYLHPQSLLVANEIIKTRVPILMENMVRWGNSNVVITNNDPSAFRRLPGYFDLVLIDAPCSGSGMFRKDSGAIDEWSEANVKLMHERQQRIWLKRWMP
ncbi:hypothetical protein FQR65_LT17645 [Abscondita terminalis]|nr:hypothetical protein FQR65_LT17645 [Abscondita terminalis]